MFSVDRKYFFSSPQNHHRRFFFQPQAFTLIEVLLVVSLMSMISIAIYRSLISGLNVWERSQRYVIEEDVAIFLDKFSYDLRNTFEYSLIEFNGKKERISFPTVVRTLIDKKIDATGEYTSQIGQVEYWFDKEKKRLFRRQGNYSQALKNTFQPDQLLAESIKSIKFVYFYYDGKELVIKKSVENIPSAVSVEIEFKEATGKWRRMKRLINIPWGFHFSKPEE